MKALQALIAQTKAEGDLNAWRRAWAVWRYLQGHKVVDLAAELDVARSAVNRWLQWFDRQGAEGLRTRKPPGAAPKLTPTQREELAAMIDAGPQAAGFHTGLWTGPMIAELIRERFGVQYHPDYIPQLLHGLRFSVQRPRKRLAKADAARQAVWLAEQLPAIKKSDCLPWGGSLRRRS